MKIAELPGNVKALLDEYKKSIDELISVIKNVNSIDLCMIVDNKTEDPECRSIQTILTHTVGAGYGYINYIENHSGKNKERMERETFNNADQYIDALNSMFAYTEDFFKNNTHLETEEKDNSKKINVRWGQQYDIEQLMEHAIVHILRHRRQIENFLKLQRSFS
ncbi:MAG TPA: DinB family protein [Ignavibacteria bacterium]|nr:DinB family protein [Ignavibacteria bacterium]